ncbi:adenosine deaminase/editase [Xylariomycetidae sp. FL0641]|nr:adenosine deaminase/editase [Xylariomycetidae sp. FL0641]
MTVTPDDIASLVLKEYDKLPPKRKPVVRDNGLHEWVPLSGIVAQGRDDTLTCLSLATGMKCLPASKLPKAQGNVLHDWHAEVLAIRAFNRFVLDECKLLAQDPGFSSDFLRRRTDAEVLSGKEAGAAWNGQPFAWREDVSLHMYCSEAPCGDASMELTMAAQEDATPWALPGDTSSPSHPSLPGRGYFQSLGIVRRKPGRGDALPTLSKSCSDKLSLKQATSLLNTLASLLVCPSAAYLRTLILPESQFSAAGCARAFGVGAGGRMAPLSSLSSSPSPISPSPSSPSSPFTGGYAHHVFAPLPTSRIFAFSRQHLLSSSSSSSSPSSSPSPSPPPPPKPPQLAPSNISTALTAHGRVETTLNGTLQGRRQFDARGASFASRRALWGAAGEVAGLLLLLLPPPGEEGQDGREGQARRRNFAGLRDALLGRDKTYKQVKECALLEPRRRAKAAARREALKGWVRNLGDDEFTL